MKLTLSELIEFKNGKKKPATEGSFPVYGGNGILDYTNQYNAKMNNLIIGRVGAYCGSIYKCDTPCWVSDNAIVGHAKGGADYNFLYYLLNSLNLNKHHIGSGQPLMTQNILNTISVDVPEYATQQKIGMVLNKIDGRVIENKRTNDNLRYILYSPVCII